MKLEVTKVQFLAMVEIADTLSAMTGGGDTNFNDQVSRNVKAFDRMLKKNGYKREYA